MIMPVETSYTVHDEDATFMAYSHSFIHTEAILKYVYTYCSMYMYYYTQMYTHIRKYMCI